MADPTEHIAEAAPIAAGFITLFITQLFDLAPVVVLMAFIGAWIGIALRDAIPEFLTKRAAVKHFLKTLFIVLSATVVSAWTIPIILKYSPGLAQKSIAGFVAFGLVYFYFQITDFGKFAFEVGKKWLSKFGKES